MAIARTRISGIAVHAASILIAAILVSACSGASLRDDIVRHEPSLSKPRATEGILWEMANAIETEHGPDHSGFSLLDGSYDSLITRLALIDSSVSSLDIQTYLWYPDYSGRLLLKRAVEAADRGVYVRLLVDDLLTIGFDQNIYELDRRPNVEVRMFNPWKKRSTLSRGGEFIAQMERLNQRMHNKLVVADVNAAIVGGRNNGDHYFGLSEDYNFHDLDLLGFGYIASQSARMFDHFWNSEWVVSADNLDVEPDPEFARQKWAEVLEYLRNSEELKTFGTEPTDWTGELVQMADELHIGTAELVHDTTTEDAIEQNVYEIMFPWMNQAQEELLITNAYIIPSEKGIEFVRSLVDRGVKVRILTNSLASHDVPAVNSHYQKWRDDFILAGVELYEARPDPEMRSIVNVPPMEAEFIGLHTKAFVVDRKKAFIGSMNFDPRSANLNTESGAFVHSPGLAEELARVMERDMLPENAWQVLMDEEGDLYWVNSDERVDKQPARSSGQRVMDKIMKIVPAKHN